MAINIKSISSSRLPWAEAKEENESRLKSRNGVKYATITMTFGVALTESEIDTAAALNLPIEEYARRMFLIHVGDWPSRKDEVPVFQFNAEKEDQS